MTPLETQNLIQDAIAQTGAEPPLWQSGDAPMLDISADGPMYLIGLIGGKEVGKSALVNALAGRKITEETSHGPGTQGVVAYAHRAREAELKSLLEREVPGRYRIITHDQPGLSRQVLLDLPDIDSRWEQHVALVRKMLRHMLFPLWVQSIEKYADAAPQKLLAQVAAGNDPANFLFCLNKADQLPSDEPNAESSPSSSIVREHYAQRIAKSLDLPTEPRVFLLSATKPDRFDFPILKKLLSQEKSTQIVAQSRHLAERRQQQSLLTWLDNLQISQRAERLSRLGESAQDLLSERALAPLLEQAIPQILDDAGYRLALTDAVYDCRVARWPIVNILHSASLPLRLLIRRNAASTFGSVESLVDAHLPIDNSSPQSAVQSTFAQLSQQSPAILNLFSRKKLWEPMDAAAAEADLRRQWIDTIQHQRDMAMQRLSGRGGFFFAPLVRFLLTIGVVLWFPLIQPVLKATMDSGSGFQTAKQAIYFFVAILNTQALLQALVFLLLWHILLAAILRWDTRRRVERFLARWKTAQHADPLLNLTTRTLQWSEELLAPLHTAMADAQRLADAAEKLRSELAAGEKNAA